MIKYRHRNCQKDFIPATFCYDLPPASLFEQMFKEGESLITFPFGVTVLHKKEKNYCKETGRYHSFRAMKQTTFTLDVIRLNEKRQIFWLKTIINHITIHIKVSTDLLNHHGARLDYIEID